MTQVITRYRPKKYKKRMHDSPQCAFSHMFQNKYENDNLKKLYSNPNGLTFSSMFNGVCKACFVSKFGLFESSETNLHQFTCAVPPKINSSNTLLQGPFLRAYKPSYSIVKDNVVFPKGTVIFPCGNLLLDILMSSENNLYGNNKPPFIEKGADIFFLNPYIYTYFKYLYEYTICFPSSTPTVNNSTRFDTLFCSQVKTTLSCLSAIYDIDAIIMSQLTDARGDESLYVTKAKRLNIKDRVSVTRNNEGALSYMEETQTEMLDMEFVTPAEVMKTYTKLAKRTLKMKQVMDDRQTFLKDLYLERALAAGEDVNIFIGISCPKSEICPPDKYKNKLKTTFEFHCSSYCIPGIVLNKEGQPLSILNPNVQFVEDVGLVAMSDICHLEYLVIGLVIYENKYFRLELDDYNKSVSYKSKKELDEVGSLPELKSTVDPYPKYIMYDVL